MKSFSDQAKTDPDYESDQFKLAFNLTSYLSFIPWYDIELVFNLTIAPQYGNTGSKIIEYMRRTWTGSVVQGIKARIFEGLDKSLSYNMAEEVFRQYNKVNAAKPSMTSCLERISQI